MLSWQDTRTAADLVALSQHEEEIRERMVHRGEELGMADLIDRIADETVGVTEEEILPFLQEKDHPALKMDPIVG